MSVSALPPKETVSWQEPTVTEDAWAGSLSDELITINGVKTVTDATSAKARLAARLLGRFPGRIIFASRTM